MKKLLVAIAATLTFNLVHSQTDMITALKAVDGLTFTEYWDVRPVEGGKNIIGEKRWVTTLHTVKNRFGQIVGFNCVDNKDTTQKRVSYYYMHHSFDHYTHPSYMSAPANNAWVIINSVLFKLEYFKSTTQFEIDAMWFPTVPKDKASDPLFKGSKMSDMKSADLKKMVLDYFVEMKKIQDANPYNPAMQEQVDAMKFTRDSTQLTYDNKNAAYWNSPEGQAKLQQLRKPRVTLINDTQHEVLMCYGSGVSKVLKPGEKLDFSCDNGKIYRGKHRPNSEQLDSTGEVLLDLDGNNCGREIKASTL